MSRRKKYHAAELVAEVYQESGVIPIRSTPGITAEDIVRWHRTGGKQPGPGPHAGGLAGWRAWAFCIVAVALGVGIVLAIILPLADWLAKVVP